MYDEKIFLLIMIFSFLVGCSAEAEYNADVDRTIISSTNLEKNESILKYVALPEG